MADVKKGFSINENVNVTEEVIAIIAGLAATEVDGVNALAGNLTNGVISKAGANRLSKGVRVAVNAADDLVIKLSLVLDYGYEIPAVCEQVQEKVGSTVENMTGKKVSDVDVHIATVSVSAND
ncbi:MAG: Asp23/Gls24 family envelope stress response protein [Lachnospiraceae bacterium]|nr:Asp23/Gls24 family envelope stress response protein [Lachnospiraceae bacterium]